MNIDWVGFITASIAVVLAPGPGSVFVAKTAGIRGAASGRIFLHGIFPGVYPLDTAWTYRPYLSMTACFMTISISYLSILCHVSFKMGSAFQRSQKNSSSANKVCGGLQHGVE